MKVYIHLEGWHQLINVQNQPFTVAEIKQRIEIECGLAGIRGQVLWDFQEQDMRTCRDADILNANSSNEDIQLVISVQGFSAWAYFHVSFSRTFDNETLVLMFTCHRFTKIVEMKQWISQKTERPMNSFQLQKANGNILDDNSNLFQCEVLNGAMLYCMPKINLSKL